MAALFRKKTSESADAGGEPKVKKVKHHLNPGTPTLDEFWRTLKPHVRGFADERRVAVALYHEMAKGRQVDDTQLGRALGLSKEEAQTLRSRDTINCFVHFDNAGRIVGFGGLAIVPMHHRFHVNGHDLWTWCAWDSLFIPEILGRTAHVASQDPESGELVRLVVTPERIASVEPNQAVISFIRPDAQAFSASATNVMAKFCHFIFFFASRSSGERWIAKNPETFLFSLDNAFALARRFNAHNFGSELVRPAKAG
jgi:alkylmercury lyase